MSLVGRLAEVNMRAFDVRFQGIDGLGPIGACLILAGFSFIGAYPVSAWFLYVLFDV
jgi:hypothetical protein